MKSLQENYNNVVLKHTKLKDAITYLSPKNEEDKLREAMSASDMEKFRRLTWMFKLNAFYKKASVTHKK